MFKWLQYKNINDSNDINMFNVRIQWLNTSKIIIMKSIDQL